VPKPGPLGAEATLGAPANQLGQPFGNRGQPVKARSRHKPFSPFLTYADAVPVPRNGWTAFVRKTQPPIAARAAALWL